MDIRNNIFAVLPTLFRAIFQVAIQKHIAWNWGTSGMFYFGQMSNIASLTNSLALGGIGNGIITIISKEESGKMSNADIKSSYIFFLLGLVFIITIGFFITKSNILINWEKVDLPNKTTILVFLIASYLGFSILTFANSILIGRSHLKTYFYIGISTPIIASILYSILLITTPNSFLIYIAPFIYAIAAIIATSPWKAHWRINHDKEKTMPGETLKSICFFLSQSSMTIISAITTPLTTFYILYTASVSLSTNEAGQLYSLTKAADIVNILFTPLISNRIYPSINNWKNNTKVFQSGIKKSLIIFLLILILTQFCATFSSNIFEFLFSKEFLIDQNTVRVYFLGDSFRILLTCFAYFIISSNSLKTYALIDIAQKLALLSTTQIFMQSQGLFGYAKCYALTTITTTILVGFLILSISPKQKSQNHNEFTLKD